MKTSRIVQLFAASVLLFAVGCAIVHPADQAPADPEPAVVHTPPTRGELEAVDSEEQQRALMLVERVTGLQFTRPFPVYVFSEAELVAEMQEWAADGDVRTPENIMGFYKPSTGAMYLVPEKAGNRRAFGLRVHEAVHALQDQHFGLARLHRGANGDDEQIALTALIEGHAVQAMIDALIDTNPRVAMIAQVPEPDDPRAPEAMTAFAYAAGTRFVQNLKEHGLGGKTGYEAVHLAFSHPPKSPEEIRSPEAYRARVAPLLSGR